MSLDVHVKYMQLARVYLPLSAYLINNSHFVRNIYEFLENSKTESTTYELLNAKTNLSYF